MYSQLFPLTLHNSYAGLFTFNRKSSLLLQWSSKEEKEPIIFLFFELDDQSVLHFLEATLRLYGTMTPQVTNYALRSWGKELGKVCKAAN